MGKPGFLSFFVVLAEISSGVNKFFWNDWGMMRMVSRKRRWVQRDAGSRRPFLQGIFERECRLPPSLRTPPPRDFQSSGLVEAEEPPRPKCQTFARERWIAARQRELLPTRFVHVVFTLPHRLAPRLALDR